MDKVTRYLFTNFISSFASLFSTLFIIMSIVFFIQIARITSIIEINFIELCKLYLFMLPRILIFTLPIAFFVALGTSFYALSKENESIVIFTLGYNPKRIALFFLSGAVILSAVLLFVSLVMMPITEDLKDNFVDYKRTKATLNIKSNKFGQKFSDWLVFIDDHEIKDGRTLYKNILLYHPSKKNGDKERIVIAEEAEFKNLNSYFELSLNEGQSYIADDEDWHVTQFESMNIRTMQRDKIRESGGIIAYWEHAKESKKRLKDFTIYVLVSLFPLATTLFALSFGIVTYRYEKGILYFGIFGVLFAYFASIMLFASHPKFAIPIIALLFFLASKAYFRYKIMRKY